jgi:hypothetical protein
MDAKRLADLLTLSRAGAAVALGWLGIAQGRASLGWAAVLLLYSWTSDFFDGPLARHSRVPHETWIGNRDLEVDMLVSAGLLVWLGAAGLVPVWLAILYAVGWAFVFGRLGVQRSLEMLVQGPIYAWFIAIALRDRPAAGTALVAWILAAIAATWPKFPQEIVPEFVAGMKAAWRHVRAGRR